MRSFGQRAVVPLNIKLTTARVLSNMNSIIGRGMNEDHSAPAVELIEDRIQPLVAEVYAVEVGEHDYAVELERIQGIGNLE